MAYEMKYTKGGFPFKSSPAKQSKKNEYNRENNQTADNSGPIRPVNQTVATDARKFEQNELVNELDDKAEYVLFVVSDGTAEKRVMMKYYSCPDRRKDLIAGWALFYKDLEGHQVEAKQEVVIAEQTNLPDDKAEYVETDIENEKVSSKKGNKIIKELNSKANKLRVPSAKSKKIEPSYPATPEGNKKRSAAEQALEKKEDEAGQN